VEEKTRCNSVACPAAGGLVWGAAMAASFIRKQAVKQ